jgi:hypothetical protein
VWIRLRPAEHLVHSLDQPLTDHVLELLGLVVDLVPGVAHESNEEELDEAMTSKDKCCELFAG